MFIHPFQTPPAGSLAAALSAASTEKAKTEKLPIPAPGVNQAKKRKRRSLPKSEISKVYKADTKAERRTLRPRK